MSTADLDLTLKAEEILAEELAGYAGRWVAVRDHCVVASADSLGGLLSRVNTDGLDCILEVSRDPKAGCFF